MKLKEQTHRLPDGTINLSEWLSAAQTSYGLKDIFLLQTACDLTQRLTQGLTTFYGQPYLEHGLDAAEIILDLNLDQETAAAAIISSAINLTKQNEENLKKELGDTVSKLVVGVKQMETIPTLQKQQTRDQSQIDKMRKMLLAMATDIRVVIIKLAERLCFMRGIKSIPEDQRKRYAQEIFDIYAPLANRLGIGQLKWELEDLAFRYQDADTYKKIASFLAERRVDREKRIKELINYIQQHLKTANITADVMGRAKHIYSIYSKTKRKDLTYKDIFDQSAVRILVPNLEDCYTALSIVHSLWPPIIEEFDDYIANPKPNGYRSIHTAVVGDDDRHFEIQIRTFTMHEEAERGVAAHWMYKEQEKSNPLTDAVKISYLRQLLDWHKEIAQKDEKGPAVDTPNTDDQIYVITPAGDILDLSAGATPLDFAYHIHTELGHRCRGAKINKQIVPLTHTLRTGDKVEIITVLQGTPSRDWLNPELGYIKTSRARSKISHWFKQQALNQDVAAGRQVLERELARHGMTQTISLNTIARHFDLKNEEALLVSLGRGNVRIGQIIQAMQPKALEKAPPTHALAIDKPAKEHGGTAIIGAADLLTRYAKCCKPIPGDAIIGYITQGRGISIHKQNCLNIKGLSDPRRFIQIDWDNKNTGSFNTDLKIIAQDKENILHDITSLLANEKISLLNLNSTFNNNQNKIFVTLTVKISNIGQLNTLVHRLQQLPGVIEVMRLTT